MAKQPLKLAIIVADDDAFAVYAKLFISAEISLARFKSVSELKNAPKSDLFSGAIIDMKTTLRATAEEKVFLSEIIEPRMPLAKFSRPGDSYAEKILRTQWENFRKECENFNPRGLRTYPRKSCFLKISLCQGESWDPDTAIRMITADLSLGGCFIVSAEKWEAGSTVTFVMGESTDPISARICWLRPWGSSLWQVPGIGVEFINISPTQKGAIMKVQELLAKGEGT